MNVSHETLQKSNQYFKGANLWTGADEKTDIKSSKEEKRRGVPLAHASGTPLNL